ncbi:hypothetical protein [Tumidithrix helvetica]|uniref:hypothetical protein n=1 Tax=Tumidithrix helvetica TaxID=3457545 RepID=UPI003CC634D6
MKSTVSVLCRRFWLDDIFLKRTIANSVDALHANQKVKSYQFLLKLRQIGFYVPRGARSFQKDALHHFLKMVSNLNEFGRLGKIVRLDSVLSDRLHASLRPMELMTDRDFNNYIVI